MPQMAPMNWLFLYFIFTIIFLLFNFLNYYLYLIKNTSNPALLQNNYTKKILNWKW